MYPVPESKGMIEMTDGEKVQMTTFLFSCLYRKKEWAQEPNRKKTLG